VAAEGGVHLGVAQEVNVCRAVEQTTPAQSVPDLQMDTTGLPAEGEYGGLHPFPQAQPRGDIVGQPVQDVDPDVDDLSGQPPHAPPSRIGLQSLPDSAACCYGPCRRRSAGLRPRWTGEHRP
jgi:hypothetical protein